jgi:hypothetical protein
MMRVFRIPVRPVGRWAALPAVHGRAVRALVYGWLAQGDPEFGERLHGGGGRVPIPFACSLLLGVDRPQDGAHLLSGRRIYALEVAALTASAAEALLPGLPHPGDTLRLKRTCLTAAGPVQELRQASYRALWEAAPARRWRFRFLSPVMIEPERTGGPLMLPVPRFLFSNLLLKWNAFAPEEDQGLPAFPPGGTLAWIEEHVQVVAVSGLETADLSGDEETHQGFVGEAEFQVTGSSDLEPWRAVSALARMAAFAGVGGRTMEGAGRVEVTE